MHYTGWPKKVNYCTFIGGAKNLKLGATSEKGTGHKGAIPQ